MRHKVSIALLIGLFAHFYISTGAEARDTGITVREYCKGSEIKDSLVPVILSGMENSRDDRFEILWEKGVKGTMYIFSPALECPLKLISKNEEFVGVGRHPKVIASETLKALAYEMYTKDGLQVEKIENRRCENMGPLIYYKKSVAVLGEVPVGHLESILNVETDFPVSDCTLLVDAFGRGFGFYTNNFELGIVVNGSHAAYSVIGVNENEAN